MRLLLAAVIAAAALGTRPPALGAQQPSAESPRPRAATQALSARLTAGERASIAKLPKGEGRDLVIGGCITCHSATIITMQRKDTTGWNRTVTQMMGWGATVPPAKKGDLVAYLAKHYPARGPGPSPPSRP